MEEPPGRVIARIGRIVEETVTESVHNHEVRCHSVPPPNRAPVTAVPFAGMEVSDEQCSHAIEMLQDLDEVAVALRIGVPLPVLQLALADYERRFRMFLLQRATLG